MSFLEQNILRQHNNSMWSHQFRCKSYAKFLDIANVKGKVVLDAGCGVGIMGLYAVGKSAKKIVQVDKDPEKVQLMHKHYEQSQLSSYIHVMEADFNEHFEMPEHIGDPDIIVAEWISNRFWSGPQHILFPILKKQFPNAVFVPTWGQYQIMYAPFKNGNNVYERAVSFFSRPAPKFDPGIELPGSYRRFIQEEYDRSFARNQRWVDIVQDSNSLSHNDFLVSEMSYIDKQGYFPLWETPLTVTSYIPEQMYNKPGAVFLTLYEGMDVPGAEEHQKRMVNVNDMNLCSSLVSIIEPSARTVTFDWHESYKDWSVSYK